MQYILELGLNLCLGKVLAHPCSCTSCGCPGKRQIHFRSQRIPLAAGWNLLMCSSHRTGPLSPWFVKPLCLSSCSGTRTERGWELRRGAGTGWLLPARWATGQPRSRYLCSCHGQFLGEHHTPDPRLKPRLRLSLAQMLLYKLESDCRISRVFHIKPPQRSSPDWLCSSSDGSIVGWAAGSHSFHGGMD